MQTGLSDLVSVGTGKWGRDQVNWYRRMPVDLVQYRATWLRRSKILVQWPVCFTD